MPNQETIRSKETLSMINDLILQGVEKISIVMRHSARHFGTDPQMEPFLGLTETGKTYAVEFGQALNQEPGPVFFSSHFGRCIETAYLMDKGYNQRHCRFQGHNTLENALAPFYIRDMQTAFNAFKDLGNDVFLRSWFDKGLAHDMMQDSEEVAEVLANFMRTKLDALEPGRIAICVSHDWNIYPLKEHKLGLNFETHGKIEFLESVVVFEQRGKQYIMNHQQTPKQL
ncbi:hypothetical protein HRM2_28900 [Desulforapulum autotrophicum HRM2]|uniref:Phosphoglycerate mutase family protein n=1 Tax=Desulforapulum autotrophicum (strain ATCC 43914 / DSM 3382 / VKM B-1955 / HRM2) TaxID=177437 RepID=C0QJG5_DESAH|nr:histidine phosphatase family protein [Desulforapulum autotrophicum]ACN15978.1 hypothetical protein HRM2_28900 [Desulforapulum autotrophicum HRM2]